MNVRHSTPASVVCTGCVRGMRCVARAAGGGRARAGARANGAHGGDDGARVAPVAARASRTGALRCHGAQRATASSKMAANSHPPPCQAQGGIAPRRSTRSAVHTSAHAGAPHAGTSRRARGPTPFPIDVTSSASVSAERTTASRASSHPHKKARTFPASSQFYVIVTTL